MLWMLYLDAQSMVVPLYRISCSAMLAMANLQVPPSRRARSAFRLLNPSLSGIPRKSSIPRWRLKLGKSNLFDDCEVFLTATKFLLKSEAALDTVLTCSNDFNDRV